MGMALTSAYIAYKIISKGTIWITPPKDWALLTLSVKAATGINMAAVEATTISITSPWRATVGRSTVRELTTSLSALNEAMPAIWELSI